MDYYLTSIVVDKLIAVEKMHQRRLQLVAVRTDEQLYVDEDISVIENNVNLIFLTQRLSSSKGNSFIYSLISTY